MHAPSGEEDEDYGDENTSLIQDRQSPKGRQPSKSRQLDDFFSPDREGRQLDDFCEDRAPRKAAAEAYRSNFDQEERQWFWRSVIENAAASEVAVNVLLPFCVCARSKGRWRPPSDQLLGVLVLMLNLVGTFLEGFCKSTRLLSQTARRARASHQLVFISSQGMSEGFLNVLTSFPDIAESGSAIALSTQSMLLGVGYSALHMVGGLLCYRVGRAFGWRCAQRYWGAVILFCEVWPRIGQALVLFAFGLLLLSGPLVAEAGANAVSSTAPPGSGLLPLDLTEPGLQGIGGARFVLDEVVFEVPPLALGLAVGVFMSASGAVIASVFVTALFDERQRPTARLLVNFLATAIVLLIPFLQPADASGPWSFLLTKFGTSFCGAISAFSGTLGDVNDAYLGSASEDSTLDSGGFAELKSKPAGQRPWLPFITGAQNLFAHWALVLVIMVSNFYQDAQEQQPPIILRLKGSANWIRVQEAPSWHVSLPQD